MKHTLFAITLTVAAGLAQAQPAQIGVLNKSGLVVAFYNSQSWKDTVKAKMAEMQAAKQAGDTAKVAELEKWGQTGQERAHQQLAGEAPLDSILEALKPALPEIARRAGVAVVVVDLPYASDQVRIVDVTPHLLDYLNSDARTRKLVAETMKFKGPIRVH